MPKNLTQLCGRIAQDLDLIGEEFERRMNDLEAAVQRLTGTVNTQMARTDDLWRRGNEDHARLAALERRDDVEADCCAADPHLHTTESSPQDPVVVDAADLDRLAQVLAWDLRHHENASAVEDRVRRVVEGAVVLVDFDRSA